MFGLRPIGAGFCILVAACHCQAALAQSTDGYHAIQVLPVVVDTTSFTQRIHLHNPSSILGLQVTPTYYPAVGTAQTTPIECPAIDLPAMAAYDILGLRALCPDLAAGGNFGSLVFNSGGTRTFAVYSRASNVAGIGFSVEAFPASAFGSALSMVTGLRRTASTTTAPAFQSNCFIGNLGELAPASMPMAQQVSVALSEDGVAIGEVLVPVLPGQLVRLLDVFSAVGAAAGDYHAAEARFSSPQGGSGGLITFCTVQDNTSFGADFRIGKQLQGEATPQNFFDFAAERDLAVLGTPYITDLMPAYQFFSIPPGANLNTHVLYLRNPDYVSCRVTAGFDPAAANVNYGLEMRLLAYGSGLPLDVLAGGNDVTGFSNVYLGDRRTRSSNLKYFLQVESNGRNVEADRPYEIRCTSGSGSTHGEIILHWPGTVF
jgi:hypothetical protein